MIAPPMLSAKSVEPMLSLLTRSHVEQAPQRYVALQLLVRLRVLLPAGRRLLFLCPARPRPAAPARSTPKR